MTMRNKPTQERGLDNPSVWNAAPTFMAYLEGVRVQVQIVYGNALCVWLDNRTARALDIPAALTVAHTPKQALAWIKVHANSEDKKWLLDYFTRLDPEAYWAECQRLADLRSAEFEQQQLEAVERMKSKEYQQAHFHELFMELSKPTVA